tara:strand:- start:833 stop:1546 length:714 start_codon:yes stop_codon:yes gene_type:complete
MGTILMRSAGCCINDVADKKFDFYVKRTSRRPVTIGAVTIKEALLLGSALALVAFVLVLTTNKMTIQLSFFALFVTIAYPYAKRWVAIPQAVLGLAFSFGIPMAFSAVLGEVTIWSWLLLISNLFWVLAYDTEYAMVDRDDDLRIGMKTSAITLGDYDVLSVVIFYLIYITSWYLLVSESLPGFWVESASIIGVLQVAWHWRLIKSRSREGCFFAFQMNHWLGMTLFLGIALQQLLG